MVKPSLPKGKKAPFLFVGAIAVVVVATFGVSLKGLYQSATDKFSGEAVKAATQKPGQQAPGQQASGQQGSASQASGQQASEQPKPGETVYAAGLAPASARPSAETIRHASAIADSFRVKRVLDVKGPLRHGDYHWDDKDVPQGPLVITVDLKAQTLSVFRNGYEIGVAVILYGATDKPTPLGVFPISEKDADHVSNLYDAPMPYMLRLTWDGVAIHGSDVKWGSATHGCIGVPTPFAEKLFGVAKLGDVVIVTDGKMMHLG